MSTYNLGPSVLYPPLDTGEVTGYGAREILRDGEKVGVLSGKVTGTELAISYIQAGGATPFSIGTQGMRQLAAQLRGEGITAIWGERVSGTHISQRGWQSGTMVKISLVGGANVIGNAAFARAEEKRVPAGEPTGGQWTR